MSTNRALPTVRRVTVAGSLVAGFGLAAIGMLLQPEFPEDPAEYIDLLAGSTVALLGLQLFTVSQLFWAIGLVGLGHAASRRSPVIGTLGALFSGLGAFGHAVYGGASLVTFAMARYAVESGDADAATAAFASTQGGAFAPYLVFGLAGTVLGVILIAVALLRSGTAPRWVPITLLVWTLVEFVLPNFISGAWTTYLSLVVGVIAFAGAALAVLRGGPGAWTTAAEAAPDSAAAKPATVAASETA